ncbi:MULTISPECIES: division plane positioning ATPase MipZ [Halobacterium]|uniref:division plane positioning ATPase MipZ n=1 Tax=Halobacterium TaxID=2239 RepID=UPI00073E4E4F|nr:MULTISPECIES: division plane positioning ATPase MipZ [Halobacterium]MCG1004286.1 ParA family protein [Halobacterium noricense]
MQSRTAALVGVAGGAGTTRTAVETAGVLARDGASVGIFDAAFATQGLAQYVDGRIDTDATSLLIDPDVDPTAARHDLAPDAPGEIAAYPAFAPFARIAEAKAPNAAERLETRLAALEATHDYVLVDTPPVAANQAVAAATSADRVAAVLPPGDRGVDSLQRARGRLADVGTGFDLAVANRVADAPPDADHALPPHAETGVPGAPVTLDGDGAYTAGIAAFAASLFDTELDVEIEDDTLLDAAREKLA